MVQTANAIDVLVVDDDRKTVDLVRLYLERAGYSVRVAYDGREALDLARARRPDLVVLDLMLPLLDGLDVCHVLLEEVGRVPVIMLTARTTEADKLAGLETGARAGSPVHAREFGRPRVWVRLRGPGAHSRCPHRQPAPQDRAEPGQTEICVDGTWRWLQAGQTSCRGGFGRECQVWLACKRGCSRCWCWWSVSHWRRLRSWRARRRPTSSHATSTRTARRCSLSPSRSRPAPASG